MGACISVERQPGVPGVDLAPDAGFEASSDIAADAVGDDDLVARYPDAELPLDDGSADADLGGADEGREAQPSSDISDAADSGGDDDLVGRDPDAELPLDDGSADADSGGADDGGEAAPDAEPDFGPDVPDPLEPAVILSTSPASPSSTSLPHVTGSAQPGVLVAIHLSADCSDSAIASGLASAEGTFDVVVPVVVNSANTLFARASTASATSPCQGGLVYVHDDVAPAPLGDPALAPASPSSNPTPTLSGGAEPGALVAAWGEAGCEGTLLAEGAASAMGTLALQLDVPADAQTAVFAVVRDAAGNASACADTGLTYTHDATPPAAPSDLATDPASPAGALDPRVVGLTEPAASVAVHASSDCSDAPLAVAQAGPDGAFEAEIAVEPDSQTDLALQLTDLAGNVSPCFDAQLAYVHDASVPEGPTDLALTPEGPSNDATPFVSGLAEPGVSLTFHADATCAGEPLGEGVAGGDGAFVFPLLLPANQATGIHVVVVDAIGNASGCLDTGLVYVHDDVPPSAVVEVSLEPPGPSPVSTPVLSGYAEAHAELTLFATETCTGAPIGLTQADASGFFSSQVGASSNALTSFHARLIDLAGNVATCVDLGASYLHDDLPPGPLSAPSLAPDSPSTDLQPALAGSTEPLATLAVFADPECTQPLGVGSADPSGLVEASLTVPADATTALFATLTDLAGNLSACASLELAYTHDGTPPAAPGDLALPPSPSSDPAPILTGLAEPGATLEAFAAGCQTALGETAVPADGAFALALGVPANAATSIAVRLTDALGNQGLCLDSGLTYTHDDQPPAAPVVAGLAPAGPSSDPAPVASGTAEPGATVTFFATSGCTSPIGQGLSDGGFEITLAVPGNVTTNLFATATDAAGNVSPCHDTGASYTHDDGGPPAPQLTLSTPTPNAETATADLVATLEPGGTLDVYTLAECQGPPAATLVDSGSGVLELALDLATNATTLISARAVDTAGNPGPCSPALGFTHDDVPPAAPLLGSLEPGSPAQDPSPTLSLSAEPDGLLLVYPASDCSGDPVGQTLSAAGTFDVALSLDADGVYALAATLTDGAGNTSPCSAPVAYELDREAPEAPVALGTTPAEAGADPTPELAAVAEPDSLLRVSLDAACATPIASAVAGSDGQVLVEVPVTANAASTLYLSAEDAAGNVSACATGPAYTHDDVAPDAPILTSTEPASPSADETSPEVNGSAEAGALVRVYPTADCSGVGWKATASPDFVVDVDLPANTASSLSARAEDAVGNVSPCSAPIVYVHDGEPPTFDSPVWSTDQRQGSLAYAWNAAQDALTGVDDLVYEVCLTTVRPDEGGCEPFVVDGTTAPGVTSYGVNGLVEDTRYYARVRAVDAVGRVATNARFGAGRTSTLQAAASIALTSAVGCARTGDGRALCWGANGNNQTGSGSGAPFEMEPVRVDGLGELLDIAPGQYTNTALTAEGHVYSWGHSSTGALGVGPGVVVASTPTLVDLDDVRVLGANATHHRCVVRAQGEVWCWGRNPYGQVGDGSFDHQFEPVQVIGLEDVVDIGTGFNHSCALHADGTVSCWGLNTSGQCGTGASSAFELQPVQVVGLADVVSLSVHDAHTCVVQVDGLVSCWGGNYYAQLGNGSWGSNSDVHSPAPVLDAPLARRVRKGMLHGFLVDGAGAAWCWGRDHWWQCGNGGESWGQAAALPVDALGAVRDVVGGQQGSCANLADGSLACWGRGPEGQLGQGPSTIESATPLPLSEAWGGAGALSLAAGDGFTCASLTDGSARCWGEGELGQLGNGATVDRALPVPVSGLAEVEQVVAGDAHACARLADGEVQCWGSNQAGQLGALKASYSSSPVPYVLPAPAIGLTAGGNHTCALLLGGEVACWGSDSSGQVSGASGLPPARGLSAGAEHTCALLADGTVACWGSGGVAALGLDNVDALYAGGDYTCARRASGEIDCWGSGTVFGVTLSATPATVLAASAGVRTVAAGAGWACAGLLDGHVTCGGASAPGIESLTAVKALAAGASHLCALRADGQIWCAGQGTSGALGDGTSADRDTPTVVVGVP